MERNLFKYVWHHSRKEQITVLSVVLISLPFYFYSLTVPKLIVNQAIQGEAFQDGTEKAPFFEINLGLPEFLGGQSFQLSSGIMLEQIPYLISLCLLFLAFVFINGGFKFYINLSKGAMGERMLRRLRYSLFERVLRFPPFHMKNVKSAETATMIKDEVEPLGGFIGDAFVQPVFLGGQAITAMAFIVVQSFWLGLIAGGIVAVQTAIIPRLRRRLLILGKQRQLAARELAGRVGEVVDGVTVIHVHDTSNYERAEVSARLGVIFGLRYAIFKRKFAVKFMNNFLAQVTPFLFYLVGGYFAITGRLDIGQLVAVIAAYKDLPSPIKELIDWDQRRLDVQIKYEQVINQFDPDGLMPAELQDPNLGTDEVLDGMLKLSNVTVNDKSGGPPLLMALNLEQPFKTHIAIVGPLGGGKEAFGRLMARFEWPDSGRINIAGHVLEDTPEAISGRRFSYLGPEAVMFQGTLFDNLVYGLKHRPLKEASYNQQELVNRKTEFVLARRTGSSLDDINADWIDYDSAGASGPEDIEDQVLRVMKIVQLDGDVYGFGLRGKIDAGNSPELSEQFLEARVLMRELLRDQGMTDLIEAFDPDVYNKNASIGENLLFGTPVGDRFKEKNLAGDPYIREVLRTSKLRRPLLQMGVTIAETMVEIFEGLPPGHELFGQFSFISSDDLGDYEKIVGRWNNAGHNSLSKDDRRMLLSLPFMYVEPRHRLGLLSDELTDKIVWARKFFADNISEDDHEFVEFYDPVRYNSEASLQDNVLFGRVGPGQSGVQSKVEKLFSEIFDKLGLLDEVYQVGLQFNVGSGGKQLSAVQRVQTALARNLLKRPDLLILNEATSVLSERLERDIIHRIREDRKDFGVISVLKSPELAEEFDYVAYLEDGKIVEQGSPAELKAKRGSYAALVAA